MTIKPQNKKIQLDIEIPEIGGFKLESVPTGLEYGNVIALGEDVKNFSIGEKIMFKAWAVDIITMEEKKYYFITCDSEGICAKYE